MAVRTALRLSVATWLLALATTALAGDPPDFTFTVVGDTFTYADAQRTFGGRIFIPAGDPPFPAIVYDHGQGGSPSPQGYPNLLVMRDWGAIVIAPTLTHVQGGETAPETTGHMPENLARGIACVDALASLADVDDTRIAFFGHSKGAYAAIGQVSALGTRVRVAAMSAGGTVPDAAGTAQAAPTATEAAGVVAPFLMFHGNIDGAVPPQRSADFQQALTLRGVPNDRVVYDVSALDSNVQHNLHQNPAINTDLLARTLAWYTQWGLFTEPALFASGFEDP